MTTKHKQRELPKGVPNHFERNNLLKLREIREYEEYNMYQNALSNCWKECVLLMPVNPVKMFKMLCPNEEVLPMDAYDDGYSEGDDLYLTTYGGFEKRVLQDTNYKREDFDRLVSLGRVFLKNNIFVDPQGSRVAAVHRIEMNTKDGLIQTSIVAGKLSDKDPHEYDSYFTKQDLLDADKGLVLLAPQIFALKTCDPGFAANQIGDADWFFDDRSAFCENWTCDPAGCSDALVTNDAKNPEFLQFSINNKGLQAFDNIHSYSQAAGKPTFADMSSVILQLNYFAHGVLNILMPKHIVLVMDSYRGAIDIPRHEYIPNIKDPLLHIPDYNNKIMHVVEMMKNIAQRGLFHQYVGNLYCKMSITPALVTISFISEYAPTLRLFVALETVNNPILFDMEERHQSFPGQLLNGTSSYLHNNHRNKSEEKNVIKSLGEEYFSHLTGISDERGFKEYLNPQLGSFEQKQATMNNLFGWQG